MSIALFCLFLLLPAYVVRFHIGPLPTTLLEIMIWVTVATFLILSRRSGTLSDTELVEVESKGNSLILQLSKNKLLLTGITLFFLGATIGVFVSSDTRAALGEWKAFYLEPILIFFILILSYKTEDIRQKNKLAPLFNLTSYVLFPLILSGLTVSLFAIYQHFTGFGVPYSFWANGNTYRVTAWYGYPNAVGLFLAPLIPLTFFLLSSFWKEIKKIRTQDTNKTQIKNLNIRYWILFVSCILFLFTSPLAILFAKGSGPLIGVAVGIATLLLLHRTTRWPTIIICLLGISGIFSLSSNNPIRQELLADNRSGRIRQAIWHETARFIADHPIAGAGLASYSQKIIPYHTTVDGEGIEIFSLPHNLFLSIWVNTGLIGLVGFILILIWFFRTAWVHIRSHTHSIFNLPSSVFTVASMLTLLTMGIVDTPYIKNDLSIFFWLLIALMYLEQSQPRQSLPHPTA